MKGEEEGKLNKGRQGWGREVAPIRGEKKATPLE